MKDVLILPDGRKWCEVETREEAERTGKLSSMPGVGVWFNYDKDQSWEAPYYALFSTDGERVDVVVRGRGPATLNSTQDGRMVFGHGLDNPYPDNSEAIEALGTAIDTPLMDYDWGWGRFPQPDDDEDGVDGPRP